MSATVGGVSPQKRGLLSDAGKKRIRAAEARRENAEAEYRQSILEEAERGASVRELAAFTGLSTNTISRWKRGE
jgi:transposase-like protein